MFYAVICRDKEGALQTRLDTRAAHLAYAEGSGMVKLGGPLIENGQMCGSLVILECDSLEAAQGWAAGDPYANAGLFASVTVQEWKKVLG